MPAAHKAPRIASVATPAYSPPSMVESLPLLLGQVVMISVSGVMAPGPVTAATLAAGVRSRHAGALVALGHGVIEFPLMIAILLGAKALLTSHGFQVGAGAVGGLALVAMGGMTLWGLRHFIPAEQSSSAANPLLTGILLTAANPYFFLWWATIGLALAVQAAELGIIAFALFAIVHWLCDLLWLEILSNASHHGTHLMGDKAQKILLGLCGTMMFGFGLWFLWDTGSKLSAQ